MLKPLAEPLNVLQLLPDLSHGGAQEGAVEMASALSTAGAHALVASKGGPLLNRLRLGGGEHIPLDLGKSASPLAYWRAVRAVRRLIRRNKVKLVHARSRWPSWVAAAACKAEKVPLVTTWHGLHQVRATNGGLFKRFYNSGLVHADRIITVSKHMQAMIEKAHPDATERLRLIPRGAGSRFDPVLVTGNRVQALLDAWSLPPDVPVILAPGRLTPWKGQHVLMAALADLVRRHPEPWYCVLAGPETDPAYAKRLYAMAGKLDKELFSKGTPQQGKTLTLTDRLRFVGACDDMPAAYVLSTLVVAPSLSPEPFGRVAVEAQFMERMVVASNHGGFIETILNGETGLLVPPGDEKALADAISLILEEVQEEGGLVASLSPPAPGERPSALVEAGQLARHHAQEHFSTVRMQMQTLTVYDELLGTHLAQRFVKALENDLDAGGTWKIT
ncbi:glycosyltransferase family 4 protein [Formicincola oecophyllae]|uniref:Glycosyltransferase family 4 protein n=2 Tax=Formicincola oecophyllae TaxID=2558361 RepID=A0A4Y6UBL8_9PROT|nr:glycosyltransferase family 4 protein [Formicincola oecophyllae]